MRQFDVIRGKYLSRTAPTENLFTLLDGACRENAFGLMFSLNGVEQYRPLYLGTKYENVMAYGPILARVQHDGEFFRWFFKEGPPCYAGGFFISDQPLLELTKQFQQFLEVRMPDGPKALFRFYDPRITKRSLTIMSEVEHETFFRGIKAYFISRKHPRGHYYWVNLLDESSGIQNRALTHQDSADELS